MKNSILKCALLTSILLTGISSKGQTTADMEDLPLGAASYYEGSDQAGNFFSNGIEFYNRWDTLWGGFWADGFAYSNRTDDSTGTWADPFSCYAGSSMGDSGKFVVALAQQFYQTHLKINGGSKVAGFHVTNNTYAALSMLNGDSFGKKFGSEFNASGNVDSTGGKDWFKLTVAGYLNGIFTSNVDFYLADYRFENDELDYIVKDWTWVDLRSLGTVDSIRFYVTSSDESGFGINTPGYFCMDNFTLIDSVTQVFVDTTICRGSSAMILGTAQSNAGIWFDTLAVDSVAGYVLNVYGDQDVTFALPEVLCQDSSITLTTAFQGTFSGNGVNGNVFDATDSLVSVGLNSITLSYTDSNGCSGTFTNSVEVIFCGGGTNGLLSELNQENVSIFPNVTNDRIWIEVDASSSYVAEVLDLNGRKLVELQDSPQHISISNLENGLYLLRIRSEKGSYQVKIIKQ